MPFLIANIKKEAIRMQEKTKVIFTNDLQVEILDNDFYVLLLKRIIDLQKKKEEQQ